jgi:hypothetical protein
VRDNTGQLIAEIKDNVWTIFPPAVMDKNSTTDSLEVRDRRGYVVLQVVLTANYVQVEGEWWRDDGMGMRIVRPFPYDPVHVGPMIVLHREGMPPMPDEPHIEPMFMYPSSEYLGRLANTDEDWRERLFILRVLHLGATPQ